MSEKVCTGTISLECHPKPPDKKPPDKPPEKPKQPPFLMITVVLLLLILTGIGGGAYTASSSDAICAPHDDCNEPERNPHRPHRRILKHGSRGEDVKRLQKILNARGLCPKPIVLDGIFGPTTLDAVKEFQRQQNLRADGVVGRGTWDRLLASGSR
jgi:Putative peptidoglycan binding domain